jgi:hypothetical protein
MALQIIDINFDKEKEELFYELQEAFNNIGPDALQMTHYELAERSGDSPISWKKFLLDPRVSAYITEELDMLKKSQVSKLLSEASTSRSTGQAQLLNTLLNQTKVSEKKEGPVFIYTRIPLNDQELGAENVR